MNIEASTPSLPPDDDLITAARQYYRKSVGGEPKSGFPLLQAEKPIAWIKFSRNVAHLKSEADTQQFIYEKLTEQPHLTDLVRVPRIYRVISTPDSESDDDGPIQRFGGPCSPSRDLDFALIVMEYIPGPTVRKHLTESPEKREQVWPRIVFAMEALLAIPPPLPTPPPGPPGGGKIVSMVFGEYFEYEPAPENFDTVRELQDHINEAIKDRINLVADLEDEPFKLCYCDPHQMNFMIGEAESQGERVGPIYIIYFQHCMWFPVVFLRFTLMNNVRDPLFDYLARKLKLAPLMNNYIVLSEYYSIKVRTIRRLQKSYY